MHRTFSVPCLIGWWSLLVLVTLQVGIHAASAQNNLQPANYPPARQEDPQRPIILMTVGTSQSCAMSTKADLKRVENPNSKVVRVARAPDRNNEVILIAEFPGRTLVTLIDHKDHAEVQEVIVGAGEVLQDPKLLVKVRVERGDQKTFKLDKIALGGLRITKSEVVDIKQAQNDPKTFTVIAIGPGTTKVYFYTDKAQQDILAVYEIEVAPEDAIGQLRDFIKTLPTAGVTATPIRLPTDRGEKRNDKAENGVILTGRVTSAQDAAAIVAVARRLFPASILGQQTTAVGGIATANDLLRENVINYMEIGGVQQVELHVVVAVVNRSRIRNMSFSWNVNGPNWFTSSTVGGAGSFTNLLTPLTPATTTASLAGTGANLALGILNNNNSFLGFLNVLTTEGVTKILAEPHVTTLSGRPANIVSGGQTPILTSSGVGAPSVSYQNFGTVVSCLPTVQGNGKIMIEVKADISALDTANGITITSGAGPATQVPGFDIRTAQSTVQIEDGQTIVIGGLIQNKILASINRVPILGDLPLVSAFFTSKSYQEQEEEMIIMVTPRLVDPIDCTKIPQYLPGKETRSPDDFEFFLEGILEAPRKPRNVAIHPREYQAAYKGAPNVGQIPCADGSCYGRPAAGCATGNCGPTTSGTAVIQIPTNSGTASNFAAPTTVTAPSIPAVPATMTSNPNRISVEPQAGVVPPPIRDIPPSFGPAMPLPPTIQPTIPPVPPRELQTRPVLPPLSPSSNMPN